MNPFVIRYLNHLGISLKDCSLDYLCQLQKVHIENIPHENIDGIFNIHTSLDIADLLNKYICENRGGLCFELNYSFAWLLNELGFQVELVLADVLAYEHHKEKNAYPTHPVIIVTFGDQQYLADVGWSDSYRNPISLSGDEYRDNTGTYRVMVTSNEKLVKQKWLPSEEGADDFKWHDQFIFDQPTTFPVKFAYPKGFFAAHAYTHVGEGYLFTTLFHYSKIEEDGHVTLWNDRLLTRNGEEKKAEIIDSIPSVLQQKFNISPHIANRCTKLTRSVSAFFSRPSLDPESVIEKIDDRQNNIFQKS